MTLNELTAIVSKEQLNILDLIWDYYVSKDSWIPSGALFQPFGKAQTISYLKALGGSIVFTSSSVSGRERCGLTFLGVLLTSSGTKLGITFLQYLKYMKERLEEDMELTQIDGADVESRLKLDLQEAKCFVKALRLSPFMNGGGFGQTWSVGLPNDVDDLLSGISIPDYFQSKVLTHYDPSLPFESNQRALPANPEPDSRDSNVSLLDGTRSEGYDVFLSFASKDQREAQHIYESIVAAGGKAFLSVKNLRPGDDFADEIRKALHESDELWLLLSPSSLRSEWVISEWGAAWALGKRIIPILFQCATTDVPDRIRKLHCIDFLKCPDLIIDRFPAKSSVKNPVPKTKSRRQSGRRDDLAKLGINNAERRPICPNCSTAESPIVLSPIPTDFVSIENATHECVKCSFKIRA